MYDIDYTYDELTGLYTTESAEYTSYDLMVEGETEELS